MVATAKNETEKERYQKYLCSREWSEKKEAVRSRSKGFCERCFINPMDACHHLTYARKYNEDLADLQAICTQCHEYTHGKRNDDIRDPKGFVILFGEAFAVSPSDWYDTEIKLDNGPTFCYQTFPLSHCRPSLFKEFDISVFIIWSPPNDFASAFMMGVAQAMDVPHVWAYPSLDDNIRDTASCWRERNCTASEFVQYALKSMSTKPGGWPVVRNI
jgi:hypothetical protein